MELHFLYDFGAMHAQCMLACGYIVTRDMVWKLGEIQSVYTTICKLPLTVHSKQRFKKL